MKKQNLLIGGIVIALLLVVIVRIVLVLATPATPVDQTPQAPTQVPSAQLVTPAPQATEQPTVKPVIPRPTPVTPTPVAPKVTHGTPQLGGLFSDFYGKYGTPHNQGTGNSESWFISEQPSIAINAEPDGNGKVVHISVTEIDLNTGDTWSIPQMIGYCAQFLPGDAAEYNRVSDPGDLWIDYNSSIGQLVELLTTGTCTLSIVQQ